MKNSEHTEINYTMLNKQKSILLFTRNPNEVTINPIMVSNFLLRLVLKKLIIPEYLVYIKTFYFPAIIQLTLNQLF